MPQIQSYNSSILWLPPGGGVIPLPCFYGITLSLPKNYSMPRPLGNVAIVNYCQGIRQPVIEFPLAVLDVNNGVLSATGQYSNPSFLDYFFTRGSTVSQLNVNDTPVMGSLVLWDGFNETILTSVKAESINILTSKGDDLQYVVRFVAGNSYTLSPGNQGYVNYSDLALWERYPLLRFQSMTISDSYGVFNNNAWKIAFALSNNHVPNYNLNGTGFAYEQRAGTPTATLQIITQANNGFIDANLAPSDPPNITVTINGAAGECNFVFNNPICISRDSHSISLGRVFKSFSYACLGNYANNTYSAPCTVYSTF